MRRRETRRAIRAMLPETVRAALYVYNGDNDEFLKVRRMTHVWLHHGDSDKEARHPAEVGGVRRPRCGRPGSDRPLRRTWGPHSVEEVQDSRSSPDREHRDSRRPDLHRRQPGRALRADLVRRRLQEQPFCPFPSVPAIVSALLARNATVIFRPHPACRRTAGVRRRHLPQSTELLRADAEATSRPHRWARGIRSDACRACQRRRTPWWPMCRGSSRTSCSRSSRSRWLPPATTTDVFRSPIPHQPLCLRHRVGPVDPRRRARRHAWATTRSHPPGSNGASTTSEAMRTENRLAPLSGTCNRWPRIRRHAEAVPAKPPVRLLKRRRSAWSLLASDLDDRPTSLSTFPWSGAQFLVAMFARPVPRISLTGQQQHQYARGRTRTHEALTRPY